MISAAEKDAAESTQALELLLERSSDVFCGLKDPFAADFGIHRWLSGAREEVYSDWLQWILLRSGQSIDVLRLFGVEDPSPSVAGTTCEVDREPVIPGGRLDLFVRCGDTATLLVEIKTTAEVAEHQWTIYPAWHQRQPDALGAVLLAIEQSEDFPEHWKFQSWERVSMELRYWASTWLHEGRQMDAVMTLGFCGAVEQNLLDLSNIGLNAVRTVRYLERWLGGNEDGKKNL
jgi:hypothetical protein